MATTSKGTTTRKLLKDNRQPLIANQEEAITIVEAISSDAEDLIDIVREEGVQEALETLSEIQTGVESLIEYFQNKE